MTDPLPEPVVSPDVYDDGYYRTMCMGSGAWEASGGQDLDPQYPGYVAMAGVQEGEVVVDLGCGRGELLVAAVRAGAAKAIGIEYAEAAVKMARTTIELHDVEERCELHHGDARQVPVADGSADHVTLLDVVEHLAPAELHTALTEARRMLKPGGRVFVHTMPNRLVYDVTYRAQRLAWPPRWRSWPKDPRQEAERVMHVNEQTAASLERALREAGFAAPDVWHGGWMWTDFVPSERAKRTYHRLAGFGPTARFGKGDLWARAAA